MEQKELLKKIESLSINPTKALLTFSQRLARENAWTESFADKVIVEYKRFVYLAAISTDDVTPSDQVDQAWHLHLTYTQSYWKDLCENILGQELHHKPTCGGPEEQQRFVNQYNHTLSMYEKTFSEKPPLDVWPPAEKRFDAVESFVRINCSKSWVIRKLRAPIDKMVAFVLTPLVLVACTDDLSGKGTKFWIVVTIGVYLLYRLIKWFRADFKYKEKSGRGGGGSGCGGSGCGGGCGG